MRGAHEKGGVEGQIGWFRRNHLVPVPEVDSFDQLNAMVDAWDEADDNRRIGSRAHTIGEMFAIEQPRLTPLPDEPFETGTWLGPRVDRYSQVTIRTNRYSVPVRLVGRQVRVHLHASGDILVTYALLGLVLLAVRHVEPVTAVRAAACIVVLGVTLVPDESAAVAAGLQTTEALRGGFGDVVLEHLRSLPSMLGGLAVQGPLAFAAFLVGLAAGKQRMLTAVGTRLDLLRRCERLDWPAPPCSRSVGGRT